MLSLDNSAFRLLWKNHAIYPCLEKCIDVVVHVLPAIAKQQAHEMRQRSVKASSLGSVCSVSNMSKTVIAFILLPTTELVHPKTMGSTWDLDQLANFELFQRLAKYIRTTQPAADENFFIQKQEERNLTHMQAHFYVWCFVLMHQTRLC